MQGPARRQVSQALLASTVMGLAAVYGVTLLGSALLSFYLLLGIRVVAFTALLLLFVFAVVLAALPWHGHDRFGPANLVTSLRAGIVSIVGSTVLFAENILACELITWALVLLVVVELCMDGVDGFLARRFRQVSLFGARFDMEVDALLILIASVAAVILGKTGWWVLMIGLMRYAFILLQQAIPRLKAELEDSFRRKAICVVQIGALCIILAPITPPSVSGPVAAFALGLLIYSFAVDTVALLKRQPAEGTRPA